MQCRQYSVEIQEILEDYSTDLLLVGQGTSSNTFAGTTLYYTIILTVYLLHIQFNTIFVGTSCIF